MFKIAIVGRPNVGKSTFFNRIVGEKKAIVSNISGLTQDRQYSRAKLLDLEFELIDTAGVEGLFEDRNLNNYIFQTKEAIKDADLIIFMTDVSTGILPLDYTISKSIRKFNKKIIHIANKADIRKQKLNLDEVKKIGFGDALLVSSEHNIGFNDLYYSLNSIILKKQHSIKNEINSISSNKKENKKIKVCFIGKPNTGKSTLINKIIGKDRLITGEKPGLTRDSIETPFFKDEVEYVLTDTAGMRKKSKIIHIIEKKSVNQSLSSIRDSDICLLLIDANHNIQKQDLLIANRVLDSGRGLIIVLSKWDLIEDKKNIKHFIDDKIKHSLSQTKDVKVVKISAITGFGINNLINEISNIYDLLGKRISTSTLNKWFFSTISQNPAPLVSGKVNSLKYISQVGIKPPSFIIFCSYPKKIPKSYSKYIYNCLKKDFSFSGLPIKVIFKKSNNPYKN